MSLLALAPVPTAAGAAETQHMMPADAFLRSLGSTPSSTELYDYFAVYDPQFRACRQTSAYLNALSIMADHGEKGFVRSRIAEAAACPSLSPEDKAMAQRLMAGVGPSAIPSPEIASTPGTTGDAGKTPAPAFPLTADAQARKRDESEAPPPAALPATADATPRATPPGVRTAAPAPPQTSPGASPSPASHTPQAAVPASPGGVATPAGAPRTPAARRIPAPLPLVRTPLVEKSGVFPAQRLLPPSPAEPEKREAARRPVSAEFSNLQYYRDGDRGTSRFYLNASTVSAAVDGFKLSASAVYVTSFSPRGTPETGSSYLTKKTERPRTEDVVFVPQAQYTSGNFLVAIGSTPIGGEVDPLPTGKLKYSGEHLGFTLYHDGVTDSLLAYVGFTDVYTGKEMGRVMRAGTKLEWQDSFAENWFYGGALSGAYLYGKNVKENTAVKGEAYIGRSFGPFAAGLYASIDHFARDLDHFTYGHGGYYSPYVAAAGAGFVSWEYKSEHIRLKADLSLGHLYEEIRDSSRYYGAPGKGEDYQGGFSNKLTTNSGLEAVLPLTANTSLTASARLITSGQYFETKGGVGLKVSF